MGRHTRLGFTAVENSAAARKAQTAKVDLHTRNIPRQPTASDAFRTSVTSMCAGVWVIAMGGRAARSAT